MHKGDKAREIILNYAKIVFDNFNNFLTDFMKKNVNILKNLSSKELFLEEYISIINNIPESKIQSIIPNKITEKYPLTKEDLINLGRLNLDGLFRHIMDERFLFQQLSMTILLKLLVKEKIF